MNRSLLSPWTICLAIFALLAAGIAAPPVVADDCDGEAFWLATTPT